MTRVRISTTVERSLLDAARSADPSRNDSRLVEDALTALLAVTRAAAIDDSYRQYDAVPLDTPDDWGDVHSFRTAAAAT